MDFEEFVRARLAALLGFARVMCADRTLAEDLVQDVLLRAQSRWNRISVLEHPDAYVRRMVVNEYLSWRRRRHPIVVADVPDRPDGLDRESQLADRDLLVRELSRLPPRQRTALALRYYAGLDVAEIAVELGCGASTVRSHLTRGLQALRVELTTEERVR